MFAKRLFRPSNSAGIACTLLSVHMASLCMLRLPMYCSTDGGSLQQQLQQPHHMQQAHAITTMTAARRINSAIRKCQKCAYSCASGRNARGWRSLQVRAHTPHRRILLQSSELCPLQVHRGIEEGRKAEE